MKKTVMIVGFAMCFAPTLAFAQASRQGGTPSGGNYQHLVGTPKFEGCREEARQRFRGSKNAMNDGMVQQRSQHVRQCMQRP